METGPRQQAAAARDALWNQIWTENPIFRQVLGICSALAVTNLVKNTLLMCLGLVWATTMSSLTVSLLRNFTPNRVRIMAQVLIISVYVIVVDIAFRAFVPEVHKDIAAYVGLIITNCIVLGRLEAYAGKNPAWPSLCDGLGSGIGYSFILLTVATVREFLAFGTFLGYAVGEAMYNAIASALNAVGLGALVGLLPTTAWSIMIFPPGAFFVLGMMVWLARWWDLKRQRLEEAKTKEARS